MTIGQLTTNKLSLGQRTGPPCDPDDDFAALSSKGAQDRWNCTATSSNTANPSWRSSTALVQKPIFSKSRALTPRAASFQFVNIATSDMGPWMQQLVNNEG